MILELDPEENKQNIFIIEKESFDIIYINKEARKNIKNVDSLLGLSMKQVFNSYTNSTSEGIKGVYPKGDCTKHNFQIGYLTIGNKKIDCKLISRKLMKGLFMIEIQLAIESSEYRDRFMANFSHEIRTPLNSIIGVIGLLNETNVSQEQQKYLKILNSSSYNLLRIVNDILDYTKLKNGNLTIINKSFYFKSCIYTAKEIVLYKSRKKNITLTEVISDDVPDFIISDKTRIIQILVNLYYNSIKFSDKDTTIETTVKCSYVKNSNHIILSFSVKDYGKGIKDSDIHKLFKSYNQLNKDLHEQNESEGVGLGLVISKQICQIMGGSIWLNSTKLYQGSEFCFNIKASICQEYKNDSRNIDLEFMKNKKVLVIDDNHTMRLMLSNYLLKILVDTTPCSTAEEALLFIKSKTHFDLVIIDIKLSKKDGISLYKEIKKYCPEMPIIALSSIGENISPIHFNLFNRYLVKPVEETKIIKICYNVIMNSEKKIKKCLVETPYSHRIKMIIQGKDLINQILLKTILNSLGYQNILMVESVEGLNMLLESDSPPDICFVDSISIDTTKHKSIYYIIMLSILEKGEWYINQGFHDCLYKPIEKENVQTIIWKYLDKQKN